MTSSPRHPHVMRFDAWFEMLLSGLVALLAVLVGAYAVRLLVGGTLGVTVPETPLGNPNPTPFGSSYVPYSPALAPLLASALVLVGLLVRRPLLSWMGAVLLLGFSFLFVFSAGGGFLPLAGLLIALLLILHIFRTWRQDRAG
jgi:hypothetical protein